LFHDEACVVVAVLLNGELKVIPMRNETKHNTMQVQTILLAGLGAHPSISGLGEAVMVESIETASASTTATTYNLGILCRPKNSEIVFKPTTPADEMLSTTANVSFLPYETIQEIALANSERSSCFFPDTKQIPRPKRESQTPQPASLEMFADAAFQEMNKVRDMSVVISPESQENAHGITTGTTKVSEPCILLPHNTMSSVDAMPPMTETGLLGALSPPVGLNLMVGDIVTHIPPQVIITSSSRVTDENDILDLTGKFTQSKDVSSLALLRGLATSIPGHRPPVSLFTSQLGPRSAIKSIQCITPIHIHNSSTLNPDNVAHVIVVRVVQSTFHDSVYQSSERGDRQLKFSISATALPPSVTSLAPASMRWTGTGTVPTLWVATGDATPNKSSLCITSISCRSMQDEDPTLRVESVQHCNLNTILQELRREQGDGDFVIKTMSLSSSCRFEKEQEMSLQLLLCRRQKRGTKTTSAPINLSRTDDAHLCLASASLRLEFVDRGACTTKAELHLGSESAHCHGSLCDAAAMQKLDALLQFVQRLEQKLETGMSNLDRRLGKVEEAMGTLQ
jgi:hypothetical protein